MLRFIYVVLLLSTPGCMTAQESALVQLSGIDYSIEQEVRYAGVNNFMGRPIRGYEAPEVMLTREAAEALSMAQQAAQEQGLSLLVFDGYRPQRAVDHFVQWGADLTDTLNQGIY